jgi:hypothetical protein
MNVYLTTTERHYLVSELRSKLADPSSETEYEFLCKLLDKLIKAL